jgi:Porin PorA
VRRRTRGTVLLVTGVLLAALGPVVRWYVLPTLLATPLNPDSTVVTTGTGLYLDRSTGQTRSGPITVTRHIQGDPTLGNRVHAAVWTITTRVDSSATISLDDPRQALQYSVHRWTFNWATNQYVACCGSDSGQGADAYIKFPFDATAPTYRLWDPTAARAFPTELQGTRTLDGHSYNEYTTTVPRQVIGTTQAPAAVVGLPAKDGLVTVDEWYENPQTMTLVDPATGSPVAVTTHEIVTLQLPGDPTHVATALNVTLRTPPATEEALVANSARLDTTLRLLRGWVPWLGSAAGLIIAAFGIRALLVGSGPTKLEAPSQEENLV